MRKNLELTLEFVHDNWWFCQRGRYDRSSVLAGQEFRQLVSAYDSLSEAKEAHPEATIRTDGYVDKWELPQTAPDWFDPLDAGEVWSEEDY